jgi:hypothetical protein
MVCDDCDTLSQDIRQEFAEVEDMRSGRRTTRYKSLKRGRAHIYCTFKSSQKHQLYLTLYILYPLYLDIKENVL